MRIPGSWDKVAPVTPDPIARFRKWFEEARRAKAPLHDAMALATADFRGRPAVRFVLLKGADERGFVFYTNALSRKARELEENPRASLVFYWDRTGKQVRIDGRVKEVAPAEADAYWKTRPRESNLAALASRQSRVLSSRRSLLAEFRRLLRKFEGRPISRPRTWTGYRVVPESIEFWTRREHRLHHRELFVRSGRGWRRTLLSP